MSTSGDTQNRPQRRSEIALWCLALPLFLAGSAAGIKGASGPTALHLTGVVLRVAAVLLLGCWAAFLRRKLTPWIVVAMFAGIEIGVDAPTLAVSMHFLSDIFLRLVKTVVAPLILATLVSGIAGHGDLKSVGRMGWKSLLYFEVLTTAALFIGLVAANVSRVGVGMVMPADLIGTVPSAAPMHWQDFLTHVFPENLAKSIADGQVLQVAVFAAIFGMGLALTPRARAEPVLRLTESLSEVMFRFTNLVMYLAPFGVASAMAYTVARMGPGVLLHLGKLLLVFYLAAAVFIVGVLLPVALLAKLHIPKAVAAHLRTRLRLHSRRLRAKLLCRARWKRWRPTACLGASWPSSFRRVIRSIWTAQRCISSMAMVFVAQVANVPLSIGQQVFMMGTLMLASKGVAGVPRAVLVVMLATAGTLRLPSEPILVLLGIDALMDMGRTAINVAGNCLASAVVARWEGALGTSHPSLAVMEAIERIASHKGATLSEDQISLTSMCCSFEAAPARPTSSKHE